MKPAGAAPQPVPKPESARKIEVINKIAVLKRQINKLSVQIETLTAKIQSEKIITSGHPPRQKTITKEKNRPFARKERKLRKDTSELSLKKKTLVLLSKELDLYKKH